MNGHEALKNPAQGGVGNPFAELVGKRLLGLLQGLTELPLPQVVDH